MIDLGFAAFLALISAGFGKRILDGLGQSPEHPLDAHGTRTAPGHGALALAALALGELGWLNLVGLSVLLAVMIELGIVSWFRLFRECEPGSTRASGRAAGLRCRCSSRPASVSCCGDGRDRADAGDRRRRPVLSPPGSQGVPDAGSGRFCTDLHETVYPLVTEMLYAVALEFRGPVACRGIQWVLGLVFAANVTALARPSLGRRAWWAGAIVLSVPAVSNGMSAPLNDVALAAFGTAAIFAWVRLHERPSWRRGRRRAVRRPGHRRKVPGAGPVRIAGSCRLLCDRLAGWSPTVRARDRAGSPSRPSISSTAAAAGGWWYLRAYVHTGNPVYPFFRHVFGGSGLDEVLTRSSGRWRSRLLNLLSALVPLSLQPDRFDSFSHQFGPVFLLFLPAIFLYRAPERMLVLVGLAYAFLVICLTQRQSMRFVLIALGPMSIAVAYLASVWCRRGTAPARLLVAILVASWASRPAWRLPGRGTCWPCCWDGNRSLSFSAGASRRSPSGDGRLATCPGPPD